MMHEEIYRLLPVACSLGIRGKKRVGLSVVDLAFAFQFVPFYCLVFAFGLAFGLGKRTERVPSTCCYRFSNYPY